MPRESTSESLERLYRNRASTLAQRFDKYAAKRLSLPTAVFSPHQTPDEAVHFLTSLTSGHPFKWASTDSKTDAGIELGIKFNSIQQGYEQIKHSLVFPNRAVRSCGVVVVAGNPDGTRTLFVNNESGHFRPDFSSISDERTQTNQAWRTVASRVATQLGTTVSLRIIEFTGRPEDSLERPQGELSVDILQGRKDFLDAACAELQPAISAKLHRGEQLFCLERVCEKLTELYPRDRTGFIPGIELESAYALIGKTEYALAQIKTKSSVLDPSTRAKWDRVTGLIRRGQHNKLERHDGLLHRLKSEVATVKQKLAMLGEASGVMSLEQNTVTPVFERDQVLHNELSNILDIYWQPAPSEGGANQT